MNPFALIIGALVIASSACASNKQGVPPPPPQPDVIDPNAQSIDSGFLLGQVEKETLQKRAESGDRDAAFRLSFHFMSAGDQAQAKSWQLAAARNGHPVAQYNQWFDLKDKMDCASMKEALAWLRSSAESGLQDAINALKNYSQEVQSCNPSN